MEKISAFSLSRISVRGVVQGVGFRPFVYQLAARHNLRGWVCNTSEDVKIEVEGEAKDIERFVADLKEQAPPLSHIEDIRVNVGKPEKHTIFEIRPSVPEPGKYQLVCPECRKECGDPFNRRFHAQPNACPICGPKLELRLADGPRVDGVDIIEKVAELFKNGQIIANTGVGGCLLARD